MGVNLRDSSQCTVVVSACRKRLSLDNRSTSSQLHRSCTGNQHPGKHLAHKVFPLLFVKPTQAQLNMVGMG